MAATLGDILLVLLDGDPLTAHELHQRHQATFAAIYPVDIARVIASLNRQSGAGYVHAGGTPARSRQRLWQLTEAGRRRRDQWLLDIRPDLEIHEVVVRTLAAFEGADRATFDRLVDACTAVLERRRLLARAELRSAFAVEDARAEFLRAELTTTVEWLRGLRTRPRDRDAASAPT
jgi:DNA-binding PadR family transcriptional regulator